ncbi:MAG: Fic family protein [Pseudomonadota bacterium]
MKQFFHNLAVLFLIVSMGAMRSLAGIDCKEPFLKVYNPHPTAPFKPPRAKRYPSRAEAPFRGSRAEEERLRDFLEEPIDGKKAAVDLIKKASEQLSPTEAKAFSDWLLGQFAEDALVNFEDHFLGRQRTEYPEGPIRYNKNGERPFEGYIAARNYLMGLSLDSIELSSIKELHRKLMSRDSIRGDKGKVFQSDGRPARNSQGLLDSELGVIRDENVGFEVDGKHLPQGVSAVGKTIAHLLHLNPFLKKTRDGFLSYAPLTHWYQIDARRELTPELVKKITALKTKYGEEGLARTDLPEIKAVQREFLQELATRIWDDARKEVKKAQTKKEVIEAVARFQRDFASVHPFVDGNGRVVRLLSEKLLETQGLTSPLYVHWGEDVTLNRHESEQHLAQSILLSQQFQTELERALNSGSGFEEVLNPVLSIRAREILGDPTAEFDSKAFLHWAQNHREEFSTFPEAVRAFSHSTEKMTPEELERAQKVMASKATHFHPEEFFLWRREHSKPGRLLEEEVRDYANWLAEHIYEDRTGAIRLASPSFQRSFSQLSHSQEKYNDKMTEFYLPEKVYRGVPSSHYLSDLELAQLFVKSTGFTEGNGAVSPLPALQQFNAGLLRDENHLRRQVVAHKDGLSDDYHMSGMVSFSEKRHVAQHWSWTPGQDYGLIFTAKQRKVGVINTSKHTSRLDQLGMHNEFEEATVGGADPESFLTVDLIQHNPNMNQATPRRSKRATRLSFDTIQIAETTFDEMDRPRLGSRTVWKILPDGSLIELPSQKASQSEP